MKLCDILKIENPMDYKFHAARWNGETDPLHVFIDDRDAWHRWNSYYGHRDEFNRRYILSFVQFPEPDTWLYGGTYEVLGRNLGKNEEGYNVKLVEQGQDLIGRLKIIQFFSRGRAFKLESYLEDIKVSEVLKESYVSKPFPGYDNISLNFHELETIYKHHRNDWYTALCNIKGIYVIVDKSNGRKYVGSAYGQHGIWARWSNYIGTGHGWNKELVRLQTSSDLAYARENFRLTLIESWPFKTDDKTIIGRENFWKEAFLTRSFGYNSN